MPLRILQVCAELHNRTTSMCHGDEEHRKALSYPQSNVLRIFGLKAGLADLVGN